MTSKVDYSALEQEYITTDISIRALAANHGVSFSAVALQSRKRDWLNKRNAYRESLHKKTVERMADQQATMQAAMNEVVRTESIAVMRATLRRYAQLLAEQKVNVTPKDAVDAARQLALMFGEPTERSEAKIVEFSTGGLDPEFLRNLEDLARKRLAEGNLAEPAGSGPEGESED